MWVLAAGAIPAASLIYGFGIGQPDALRWLAASLFVSIGLIWLSLRKA